MQLHPHANSSRRPSLRARSPLAAFFAPHLEKLCREGFSDRYVGLRKEMELILSQG